jgi:hypothetical protein
MKSLAAGWVEVLRKEEILRTLDKNGRDLLRATQRQGVSILAASICGGAKSGSNAPPEALPRATLSLHQAGACATAEHVHST